MTWEKKKILVIAKAVPEITETHGDIVCTAGITEEGEFIRIYPIPFRIFCGEQRFSKFDWIEAECKKSKDDKRKESYKVKHETIRKCGNLDTSNGWKKRNDILFPLRSKNLCELAEAFREGNTSLGIVRVDDLIEFYVDTKKDTEPRRSTAAFQCIFDQDPKNSKMLKMIPKIEHTPRKYSYIFKCEDEKDPHDIICEDWELFESERRWAYKYETKEELWEKIHQKYFTHFKEKCDLHFIMGTHFIFRTPIIIGVYYPLKDTRKIVPLDSGRWGV